MEKTKHNTFLDLSKCSEDEKKEAFLIIGFEPENRSAYMGGNECLLFFDEWEKHNKNNFSYRTELGFTEWKQMMDPDSTENLYIEQIKDIAHTEGVLIGLKICKELWGQGTISYENIQEEIYHYQEELDKLNKNEN